MATIREQFCSAPYRLVGQAGQQHCSQGLRPGWGQPMGTQLLSLSEGLLIFGGLVG